jgi:DNA polymerase
MYLVLDFSQVEPRCLNWLVGNEEMMEALRHGFSYYEAYCAFARGWKGAPGTLKSELGLTRYTLLKNECLGLGYGMGVDRFIEYAAENGNTIPAAEAKPVVDGFRERNKKIVQFWRKLDNLIISAARDKSKQLDITMPSGDLLKYFSVRNKRGGGYEGYTIKGDFSGKNKQFNLWGGTLTENVTQRMSRDILAESVVRLEDSGVPVAFHSHDEVILVVDATEDEKRREEIKREAEQIMLITPDWCAGLPLGVDGNFCDRYTKF